MGKFWLSWFDRRLGEWEYHGPWWISGHALVVNADGDEVEIPTICAAVVAADEDAAKAVIIAAHDHPPETLEWRFCEARSADWTPFNDRFPRGSWMKWPEGDGHG